MKHAAAVLAVVLVVAAAVASAAALARPSKPAAGPWYSSSERKALIAYANASFHEKQRILRGGS